MVGTHEKSYRTFVGDAIYVSAPELIDPRVNNPFHFVVFSKLLVQLTSSLHCFHFLRIYAVKWLKYFAKVESSIGIPLLPVIAE